MQIQICPMVSQHTCSPKKGILNGPLQTLRVKVLTGDLVDFLHHGVVILEAFFRASDSDENS